MIDEDDKVFKSKMIVPIGVSSFKEISCSRDSMRGGRRRRRRTTTRKRTSS